ncbi:MAG: sigma-54-dependent Fis family transcriptional regulator [Candidatus Marinimicrobia bacterium]|nr:sigma-54-dependent Fis family transcriptional regulator [Candidatus Neomarinimicrobiota bacterium]
MYSVLLIDDDMSLSRVLGYQLEQSGFDVVVVNSGKDGLEQFKEKSFDIVVTDIQMPDMSGIEVLGEIRKIDVNIVIILITAYGSVDNAIEACRLGADDYLTKPFGQEQLLFVIEKAMRLRELQSDNTKLRRELKGKHNFSNLVTNNSEMESVLEMAGQIADSETTTLILGESGTGKELIAKAVHYNSSRAKKPLITVNCPSIPDNLLESELFGHVRGSFTGAIRDRKGKFEMANGGTIFLDEIGDLRETVQAKLLRVLQEQEIERLGDSKTTKVNVRIIAATNKDLWQLSQTGKFREDLYYRLSVIPITIPPLRDRSGDVPILINHFLKKYSRSKNFKIDSEVFDILDHYSWPGNIRELENLVQRLVTLTKGELITSSDLPGHIRSSEANLNPLSLKIPADGLSLHEVEEKLIRETLQKANGNQSKAARLLKIPRHVLLYRLKKLGIVHQ